jgi:myosin V
LEQIEYKAEGIEWSFIEFPNNQDCLDLIGLKGKGIFAALDDECHVPKGSIIVYSMCLLLTVYYPAGSDQGFVNKMYTNMTSFSKFSATQPQKQNLQFCVTHYAGPVVYNSDGFMVNYTLLITP